MVFYHLVGLKDFFDLVIRLTFTTRNGLFFGMIFTLIGFFIYDHQEKLSRMGKHSSSFLFVIWKFVRVGRSVPFSHSQIGHEFYLDACAVEFFLISFGCSQKSNAELLLKKITRTVTILLFYPSYLHCSGGRDW